MRVRLSMVFVLVVAFSMVSAAAAVAQPDNDDFEAATFFGALPFDDVVDVTDATVQPDEPTEVCAPMGNTVWYGMALEATTEVTVDTTGSDYDTVLAVWTGEGFGLFDLIDCVDDTFAGLQAAVTFTAEAGVTYFVQAGAFDQVFEPSTLSISFTEAGATTGKPTIHKSSFRGLSASAFSESFDEQNGGFVFADVHLQESRDKSFQQRPFKSVSVSVFLSEEFFDEEHGTFTFTEWFGFEELDGSEYSLDRRLLSASVATTVTMFGQSCTEGPFEENGEGYEFETECIELGPVEASLDVAWDGDGPVFRSRFMDRSSSEGFRASFMIRSESRSATVEGGLEGDGVFFDFSDADGFLSRDAVAEMVVIRGAGGLIIF